jgi:type II secretory pathway component PulM
MIIPAAFHALLTALRKRISLPVQLRFQTASGFLARLSPRERRYVAAAGTACLGAFFYLVVLDPLWQMQLDLQARVTAKERELREMMTLQQEYRTAKAEVEQTQSTINPTSSPVAFLEELARSTVGQEKVTAISPTAQESRAGAVFETIELKLSGVSLREIVDLLYKIETTGQMLHPNRLSIKKRYKDPYTFDVFLSTLAISAR